MIPDRPKVTGDDLTQFVYFLLIVAVAVIVVLGMTATT